MESTNKDLDVYEAQLKDVYDSCDKKKTGILDESGLKELCHRLLFGPQADVLLTRLTEKQDQVKVTFDVFKDAFLNVLMEAQDISYENSSDIHGEKGDYSSEHEADDHCVPQVHITEDSDPVTFATDSGSPVIFPVIKRRAEEPLHEWDKAFDLGIGKKVCSTDISFLPDQRDILNSTAAGYMMDFNSYQEQIQSMNVTIEQLTAEKSKLQQNLMDANNRSILLAEEVDERHAEMENAASERLRLLEAKYQDQLKQLKLEAIRERENFLIQESKQKQMYDRDLTDFKAEESALKTKLADALQDLKRLEEELRESAEKYIEAEKQITKLSKEQKCIDKLQRQISELERKEDYMDEKESNSCLEQLEKIKNENKDLTDKCDILTTELEHVQQLSVCANCHGHSLSTGFTPHSQTFAKRRRLPSTPYSCQNSSDGNESSSSWLIIDTKDVNESGKIEQKTTLEEKDKINAQLQADLDKEVKDKGDLIAEHEAEMKELTQNFENTKQRFQEEFEEKLKEREKQLKDYFGKTLLEKNNIIENFEREKVSLLLKNEEVLEEMKVSFNEEKIRIEDYYSEKIEELKLEHEQEIEQMLSRGAEGLEGKLSEDFYELLNTYKEEERNKLYIQWENNMEEKASGDSQPKTCEKKENLEEELNQMKQILEEERENMNEKMEIERQNLEETLAESLREELNDEFCHQIDQLRETFADERRTFESQNILLEGEIEELQMALSKEETTHKKCIEDLNKKVSRLQQEKKDAVRQKEDCEDELLTLKMELSTTRTSLEEQSEQLLNEKEKLKRLESNQTLNFKEKAEYESLLKEKEVMSSQISQLYGEIDTLQEQALENRRIQDENENLKVHMTKVLNILKENDGSPFVKDSSDSFTQLHSLAAQLVREKHEVEEKLQESEIQQAFAQQFPEKTLYDSDTGTITQNEESKECREQIVNERNSLQRQVTQLQEQLDVMKSISFSSNPISGVKKSGDLRTDSNNYYLKEAFIKAVNELLGRSTELLCLQEKHLNEIQGLTGRRENIVNDELYNSLQINLVEQQRKMWELQQFSQNHVEIFNNSILESEVNSRKSAMETSSEVVELKMKLRNTEDLLQKQNEKLKSEIDLANRRNILLTDLSMKKAELLDALKVTEERQKKAESKCFKLEGQCNALKRAVKALTMTANKYCSP